jgi:hypothetical protein
MVSQESPPLQSDRDAMKAALVEFLSVVPLVYGLKDRLTQWEKIGNAVKAALETCNGSLDEWVNQVLEGIQADEGRTTTCETYRAQARRLESQTDAWKSTCLQVLKSLWRSLPGQARDIYKATIAPTWKEPEDAGDE